MEPLSIATGCVGLLSSIATLSRNLTSLVSVARQARKDVDGFSRELSSLELCVSTLKDETFQFPPALQKQLLAVLSNCDSVIGDMTKIINKHNANHLGRQIQWSISDRDEVCRLRERLEAHKSALEITLELASLTVATSIKEDTTEIKAELVALRIQVMQLRDAQIEPNPILQRYLNDSIAYAESVVDPFESASEDERTVVTHNDMLPEAAMVSDRSTASSDVQAKRPSGLQTSQDNGVWLSQAGPPSKPTDDSLLDDAVGERNNQSAQDRKRLDSQLWSCFMDLRARTLNEDHENHVRIHLEKASNLINLGARYRNGLVDFSYERASERGWDFDKYPFHSKGEDHLSLPPATEFQIFRLLLNHGHSIRDEQTALLRYLASFKRANYEIILLLLAKADVHSALIEETSYDYSRPRGKYKYDAGDTALHIAATHPDLRWLVPELVKHGAHVNQKNSLGETTLDNVINLYRRSSFGVSKEYEKPIRLLRQVGGTTTYDDGNIRFIAEGGLLHSIYYSGKGFGRLARYVASRHGLVVNIKRCCHLNCENFYCGKWKAKNRAANKDLITAYEQDILDAVHGPGYAS